jgi:hypothetical protein
MGFFVKMADEAISTYRTTACQVDKQQVPVLSYPVITAWVSLSRWRTRPSV